MSGLCGLGDHCSDNGGLILIVGEGFPEDQVRIAEVVQTQAGRCVSAERGGVPRLRAWGAG